MGQEYKPEAEGKQHPELVTVTPWLVKHIVKQIVLYAIWTKAFPSTLHVTGVLDCPAFSQLIPCCFTPVLN